MVQQALGIGALALVVVGLLASVISTIALGVCIRRADAATGGAARGSARPGGATEAQDAAPASASH
jgi:hypothetical protein